MVLRILHEIPFLRNRYFNNWGRGWTNRKIDLFVNWISTKESILDIGCGNGLLTHILRERQYNVTPLDVEDQTYSPIVKPIVYDGENIPFRDSEFNVGLLIAVLHHTKDPLAVLKEASRTAKNLIILEDVYESLLDKCLLYAIDSFINLAYSDLNFNHKTDEEWEAIFCANGLEIEHQRKIKTLGIFKQVIYYVKRK